MKELIFIVKFIIFQKDGFAIVRTNSEQAVLGNFKPVMGQCYKAEGEWEESKREPGVLQFKAETCAPTHFTRPMDLARYLARHVEGVGIASFETLVADLGERLESVLDGLDVDTLAESIGPKRAKLVVEAWPKLKPAADLISPLIGYGLSEAAAEQLVSSFGADAIRVVEEKPYSLPLILDGVGFLIADRIAMKLGVAPTAPLRLKSAMAYAMREATRSGSIGVPKATLLKEVVTLVNPCRVEGGRRIPLEPLSVSEQLLRDTLEGMLADDGEDCRHSAALVELPDEKGTSVVWYAPLLEKERGIARKLAALNAAPLASMAERIDEFAARAGMTLAPEQREAVRAALIYPWMILTGGPGCGKSATLKVLLAMFDAAGLKGMQGAPTGIAAKRISESTGRPAQTLHSAFAITPGQGSRLSEGKANFQYLVIDEAGMSDTELTYFVLQAIPTNCRVIIVGDVDQLPSVGPGQVLRDLIRSNVAPVVRLTKVFRQGAGSGIIEAAAAIRKGQVPETTDDGQFVHVDCENPGEALLEHVRNLVDSGVNPDTIQVLAPFHKGSAGCIKLNADLQALLNPEPRGKDVRKLKRDSGDIRVNDRVIQNKNNAEYQLVNGDIGMLAEIGTHSIYLELNDGRSVTMPQKDANALALAYAITIHKSQGAEAPIILIALDPANGFMLRRELVYTGETRAAKQCTIFGPHRTLEMAVKRGQPPEGSRRTRLCLRLKELMPEFKTPVETEALEDLPF